MLVGRDLLRIRILGGRYVKKPPAGFSEIQNALGIGPLRIEEVGCKGKFIYWRLEDGWSVWNTLGMTGTWSRSKQKHAAVRFSHSPADAETVVLRPLFFADQRRFGTLKFVQDDSLLQEKLSGLGADLLQEDPGWVPFYCSLVSKPTREITQALMDQKLFAGVGNYIKADALYLSRISPRRIVNTITPAEARLLYDAVREVMITSYESGGNTISDYRDVNGQQGEYRRHCYGRTTDVHGNLIIKESTQDKRSTWWCPSLQS